MKAVQFVMLILVVGVHLVIAAAVPPSTGTESQLQVAGLDVLLDGGSPASAMLMKYAQEFNAAVYSNVSAGNSLKQEAVKCPRRSCPLVEKHKAHYIMRFDNTTGTGLSGMVAFDTVYRHIVVVFRASEQIKDAWARDGLALVAFPFLEGAHVLPSMLLAWNSVKQDVTAAVANWRADGRNDYKILVVGRGLGGAIANIAAAYLRNDNLPVDLVTFGTPPLGDTGFATQMDAMKDGLNYRVVLEGDPYVEMPPPIEGLRHFGTKCVVGPVMSKKQEVKREIRDVEYLEFDGGSPFYFGDILGEIPGGAQAAQHRVVELDKWLIDNYGYPSSPTRNGKHEEKPNTGKPTYSGLKGNRRWVEDGIDMGIKDAVPFHGEKSLMVNVLSFFDDLGPVVKIPMDPMRDVGD